VHIADGEARRPDSLETICHFAPLDGWHSDLEQTACRC